MDDFSKYWISNNDVLYYHHSFGFYKETFENDQVKNSFNLKYIIIL